MGRKAGRKIVPGGSVRVRNAASARNAKPKVVSLKHGGKSALLHAQLRKNSPEYKFIQQHALALVQQMGGEEAVTPVMAELIDQAARLRLLERLAFAELIKGGLVQKGQINPAFAAFLQAVGRRSSLLTTLGLERKQREVNLNELLAQPMEKPE